MFVWMFLRYDTRMEFRSIEVRGSASRRIFLLDLKMTKWEIMSWLLFYIQKAPGNVEEDMENQMEKERVTSDIPRDRVYPFFISTCMCLSSSQL